MQKSDSSMQESWLSLLPAEIASRMVSYLPSADAVNLSDNLSEVGVTISCAGRDRCLFQFSRWDGAVETGDEPLRSIYRIPVLTGITHSISLKFQWKDQGWGNQKGQVYIVAAPKKPNPQDTRPTPLLSPTAQASTNTTEPPTLPFQGGRVVCMTEDLAPQTWRERVLSFTPRDDEIYHLWHKAGGGGGHELLLQNFGMSTFLFDDAERSRARMYDHLLALGVVGAVQQEQQESSIRQILQVVQFPFGVVADNSSGTNGRSSPRSMLTKMFYPKLLLRVCSSLLRQLESIEQKNDAATSLDPDLVDFMKDYEVPVNGACVRAVKDVVSAEMEDFIGAHDQAQESNAEASMDTALSVNGNDGVAAAAGRPGGGGGGDGAGAAPRGGRHTRGAAPFQVSVTFRRAAHPPPPPRRPRNND